MNSEPIERLEGAFRFKRFTIRQQRSAMKVGTDGVLLGAWAGVRPTDRRILDIGTGTGLIAVMLAQRTEGAVITGVDIDDVTEARENGEASPWGDRLHFVQQPIQQFRSTERFDLIVSNPPFYVDALVCPDLGRTTARHTVHLSYGELLDAVVRLLSPGGRFAVVLPTPEDERFRRLAARYLRLDRLTTVRTTPRRPVKRVLMEFSLISAPATGVPDLPAAVPTAAVSTASAAPAGAAVPVTVSGPQIDSLTIGTGAHETYTPEYRALTRDFYLKF